MRTLTVEISNANLSDFIDTIKSVGLKQAAKDFQEINKEVEKAEK